MKTQTQKALSAETIQAILNLKLEDVGSVYSGRPGCACGCRGEYRYSSVEAFKTHGPGYGEAEEQVNPRQVRKVLTIIQTALQIDPGEGSVQVIDGGSLNDNGKIISFDYSMTRIYTLYTTGKAAQGFPEEQQ